MKRLVTFSNMVNVYILFGNIFQQVKADDAGQYTIAGLHDLDQGWMSEVKNR